MKTYSQNYKAQIHSAAHNASVGVNNSVLAFNETADSSLSKGSKAIEKLQRLMTKQLYITKWQNSVLYAVRQKQLRQRKLKVKQLQKLPYRMYIFPQMYIGSICTQSKTITARCLSQFISEEGLVHKGLCKWMPLNLLGHCWYICLYVSNCWHDKYFWK